MEILKSISSLGRNIIRAIRYRDGSVLNSTTVSTTLSNPNVDFYIFARNTDGTPDKYSTVRSALLYIASGLTPAEAVILNTLVNTFQTTLGRNV